MVCGGGVVKSRVITSINKTVLALERGFFVQTEFSLSSKVQFVPGEAVEGQIAGSLMLGTVYISSGLCICGTRWFLHPSPAFCSLLR